MATVGPAAPEHACPHCGAPSTFWDDKACPKAPKGISVTLTRDQWLIVLGLLAAYDGPQIAFTKATIREALFPEKED